MVVSTTVKSVPITPMRTPSPTGAQPFRLQVAASKVAKQASVVNALHRPRRQTPASALSWQTLVHIGR